MRAITWLSPFVVLSHLACGEAAHGPPFQPVADVKQLMQAVIDPSADTLWDASGAIVTATETIERRPRNDEEWARVRNAAVVLAESGNLLMMLPRAKDGDVWMKRSQELVDTGTEAWKAAEARDADRLFTVGGDVYDACSHCHEDYMDAIKNANP
jgi:hypothetical protein